ncbi:MAG TPA: ATP-binding protein [Pseudomonadales bacterium]|nr:ATP-binding protein [Pseudomonadales bacterium]
MHAAFSIVVVGVESTGKTTLARALAERLGWPLVAEQARAWLASRDNRYGAEDLPLIAALQDAAERDVRARHGNLVADTDLSVLRIWSEVRFGHCDRRILDALAERPPACYLLTRPDLPWEADPQRETPDQDQRLALHDRYRALLAAQAHPWREIGGVGPARLAQACAALGEMGLDVA